MLPHSSEYHQGPIDIGDQLGLRSSYLSGAKKVGPPKDDVWGPDTGFLCWSHLLRGEGRARFAMRRFWAAVFFSLVWTIGVLIRTEASPPETLRVVVDPGHGGKDKGTRGVHGVLEKDVTLVFARELREEARATGGGIQIRLTRETDETFGWPRREDAAQGADLWLSIHFNADFKGKARGPRVFYGFPVLQSTPGKARLNSRQDPDVRAILQDMALTKKGNESLLLAEHLQRAMESVWALGSRPTREVPLVGLPALEIPAVLLEVGFLTHPGDVRTLQDEVQRKAIVKAVLKALRSYIADPRRER